MTADGVVIVGGGLAATRISEQLRKAGYDGAITIVSDEEHPPYDRPPLSKDVLTDEAKGLADVVLKPAEFYAENGITLRLGSAAQAVDTGADGDADRRNRTGLRRPGDRNGPGAQAIPALPDLAGIRVLRTIGEALGLRQHAAAAARAVVIGAGFIGCEVAAGLRASSVSRWRSSSRSLHRWPGCWVNGSADSSRLHRAEGVDVRTGVGVSEVVGQDSGHVSEVVLSDGTVLEADLVIIGIGSRPATGWLTGSGVDLAPDGGVLCDEVGQQCSARLGAG